jgi:putative glutamine amidotransferase
VSRPLIAVSGVRRVWRGAARTGVNAVYADAVLEAGGIPLVLPPTIPPTDAGRVLEAVQGVLLTGGEDIDPARYGATPSPRLGPVDAPRDALELALFDAARAASLPVLGICRGLQLINVAMGGDLWQDLPTERPSPVAHDHPEARHDRTHGVDVTDGSRAAAALGVTRLDVNTFHHQGIRRLAHGLVASATADDGLVEAVEAPEGGWLLAVQWHPEEFTGNAAAPDLGLFRALTDAARLAYCR